MPSLQNLHCFVYARQCIHPALDDLDSFKDTTLSTVVIVQA